jgi:hypothetical protein
MAKALLAKRSKGGRSGGGVGGTSIYTAGIYTASMKYEVLAMKHGIWGPGGLGRIIAIPEYVCACCADKTLAHGGRWLLFLRLRLGFGRIVVSETGAPNMFVNLVRSGWAAVPSDNATEPDLRRPLQHAYKDTAVLVRRFRSRDDFFSPHNILNVRTAQLAAWWVRGRRQWWRVRGTG